MPNTTDLSLMDDFDDSQRMGRIARFKATRTILNVQIHAKVSDGSFRSKTITCRHLSIPENFINPGVRLIFLP